MSEWRCDGCDWWVAPPAQRPPVDNPEAAVYGTCKRFPQPFMKIGDDWCGEYSGAALVVSLDEEGEGG